MRLSAAKQLFETAAKFAVKVLLATGGAAALLIFFAVRDGNPVLIQSKESKTAEGGPVFNRISFKPGPDKDVWVMQQSHFGLAAPEAQWDRIAITVTHGDVRTASFSQLSSGPLALEDHAPATEKKARCYMCHSNGPRVIRPEYGGKGSVLADVSYWDRFRLLLWNIRIKTYGTFAPTVQDSEPDYRVQSALANDPLRVAACTKCHPDGESSVNLPFARGTLRRQHYGAIDFMLANGLMPPPGFSISEEERAEVLRFIGRLSVE